MDWPNVISTVLGTGAAAASGGVFGLFGSIIGAWTKMKKAKQEHEFQRDKWAYETDLLKLQMQAKQEENEQAIALASSKGSWASLEASVEMDRRAGESYKWVNAVKDLFRPVLTVGLFVLVYLIFTDLVKPGGVLEAMLAPEQRLAIVKYIVYSIVFAATTAGVWWFGDRALSPPGMKNR